MRAADVLATRRSVLSLLGLEPLEIIFIFWTYPSPATLSNQPRPDSTSRSKICQSVERPRERRGVGGRFGRTLSWGRSRVRLRLLPSYAPLDSSHQVESLAYFYTPPPRTMSVFSSSTGAVGKLSDADAEAYLRRKPCRVL